jgi:glycosyltransferase involved in cell wall biosynthesis
MGIEEVVEEGVNGLLVPVGDVEGLARAMETLIRDRARLERMAGESRAIACRGFSWDVIVDRYLSLLIDASARR